MPVRQITRGRLTRFVSVWSSIPSFEGTAERYGYVNGEGGKVQVFQAYLRHHPRYCSPLILTHRRMGPHQGRQP